MATTYYTIAATLWRDLGDNPTHVEPYVAGLEACGTPKRVLDIGTGAGVGAAAAARQFPNAEVIGVDTAPGMIKVARAKHAGVTGLSFQRVSPTKLPFPDGSFDLVTLLNAVCDLDEVVRVLTDDGKVLNVWSLASAPNATSKQEVRSNDMAQARRAQVGLALVQSGQTERGLWEVLAKVRDTETA